MDITEDVKIAVIGNVDSGKCLAKDTAVMLFNGTTKRVQDISVGETLMGDDSRQRKVLATTRGAGQLYNVTQTNGDTYTVNVNHILVLLDSDHAVICGVAPPQTTQPPAETGAGLRVNLPDASRGASRRPAPHIINMSVKDYIELPQEKRNGYRGLAVGVDFPAQPVGIDPYALGYWLGQNTACTASRFLYFSEQEKRAFHDELNKYGLIEHKHVPDAYKYNSHRVRYQILAGVIESSERLEWGRNNEHMCDEVVWLARSLGYCANKNVHGEMFKCIFTLDPDKISETSRITVTPAARGEYYGFELDGNQQFLLADFTVTHNSSLVGTLLRGKNDDGRGANRELVMNYRHEKETGQTSSVGYQILGFRKDGTIVHVENKSRKDTWPKIMQETHKLVTFMDLAGHEKYLKTTIHGLSANHPDYALILIEGRGIRGMTSEHIMLALSFGVPFVILITKTDLYTKEVVAATIERVGKLIKQAKKDIWLVRDEIDLQIPLQQPGEKFVPVFTISNVTGDGLQYFKEYLRRLPKRIDYSPSTDEPFEMAVIEGFTVQGIGTVAHGFLARGTARVGDPVWIGPDSVGNYHKSKIRSIQFKRINVDFVLPGHHCTVCLPSIERKILKQGTYVIHDKVQNKMAVRKFTANVKVLTSHPITIKRGYCPILNVDNIRMAARVLNITTVPKDGQDPTTLESQEFLRGGGRARIQFKFIYRPAYLRADSTFVFREGKTRGFGKVTSIDLEQIEGGVKPTTHKKKKIDDPVPKH